MKRITIILTLGILTLIGCDKNDPPTTETTPIDGAWELYNLHEVVTDSLGDTLTNNMTQGIDYPYLMVWTFGHNNSLSVTKLHEEGTLDVNMYEIDSSLRELITSYNGSHGVVFIEYSQSGNNMSFVEQYTREVTKKKTRNIFHLKRQ